MEGSIIVISFGLIIGDIAIVDLIVVFAFIIVGFGVFSQLVLMLKVILKGGIVVVGDSFEFLVGVEAEDHTETVIEKTKDRVSESKGLHTGIESKVSTLLNGYEEVSHEIDSEEDADEDEHHDELVADLTLNHEQDEQEQNTEDGLL